MTPRWALFAPLPLLGGACGGILGGVLNDVLIRRLGNRRWAQKLRRFHRQIHGRRAGAAEHSGPGRAD